MAATIAPAQVEGLKEFRAALRQLGPQWGRMLSKTHRDIAKKVAATAQSYARGTGKQQARMAAAIKGSGTQSGAAITVNQSTRHPYANVAFWGQTKRTGWYAAIWAAGHHDGRAQALPWVGSDWQVGVSGEGPYAINDAIEAELPGVMDTYRRELDALFFRAFPD